MKLPTISGLRIRKFYRVEFLTPFCNQKLYIAFFNFYLDKVVMSEKEKSCVSNTPHSIPNTSAKPFKLISFGNDNIHTPKHEV